MTFILHVLIVIQIKIDKSEIFSSLKQLSYEKK